MAKVRSPSVERRVAGTTRADEDTDRRPYIMFLVLPSLLVPINIILLGLSQGILDLLLNFSRSNFQFKLRGSLK